MKDLISLATPLFFVLIVVETIVAWRTGKKVYRFTDAVTDLGAGVVSEVAKVFLVAVRVGLYTAVYDRRIADLSSSPALAWVVALLGVDFFYYWWHRLSHEVNVLWAAHVVHHTSEDYNLAVALRQAVLTHLTGPPFYLLLALVGVPPAVYLGSFAINLVYQFWIHTELVRKLGSFELLFNTPSHHRVHHAVNPQYLDKNYGGILIVWDKMFGTFEPEREECVYGTVKPLASYNPLTVQFHYWGELLKLSVAAPRPMDKLRVWWKSPEFRPEGLPAYPSSAGVTRATRKKYEPRPSRGALVYAAVQFAFALAVALVVLAQRDAWPLAWLVLGSALVVVTLLVVGGLFERRAWAKPLEAARLVAIAAIVIGAVAAR